MVIFLITYTIYMYAYIIYMRRSKIPSPKKVAPNDAKRLSTEEGNPEQFQPGFLRLFKQLNHFEYAHKQPSFYSVYISPLSNYISIKMTGVCYAVFFQIMAATAIAVVRYFYKYTTSFPWGAGWESSRSNYSGVSSSTSATRILDQQQFNICSSLFEFSFLTIFLVEG